MTNKEAIRILDNLKPTKRYDENDAYYIGQALTMAIQALEQKPCGDCISRKQAYESAVCIFESNSVMKAFCMMQMINELPSVTPKEKVGHWILIEKELSRYKCSECGEIIRVYDTQTLKDYPYSHCGARMGNAEETTTWD